MTKFKQLLVLVASLLLAVSTSWAQATLTSTTLSAAITGTSTQTFTVASATGFSANRIAYVDREALRITAVSGTTITAVRGISGTRAATHTSGQTIYVGPGDYFTTYDRSGSCTSTSELVLPLINVSNGNIFQCTSSVWARQELLTTVTGTFGNNLDLTTVSDGKPVRINSRNFAQTSGSSIGFQSKPAQTVTSTGSVIGGEISPRVNNDIDIANVIGLHVDAYLKGTTAKTVSGDVRGMQIELVTDDAGTNTISGNVSALRIRAAFSASTLTGTMEAIRIEKAEAQTNSQNWDSVLTLTSTQTGVWHDTDADSGDTEAGYIKVMVNGNARYILLYSDAPTL